MIKYVAVALSLKSFSSCPEMRRLYRQIGNNIGGRRRASGRMPTYYAARVKRMLRIVKHYNIIRDGDRILEVGTGWLHWEALTLRLFYDVQAVLFDVWDNRQLAGLKNYVQQLSELLESKDSFGLSDLESSRARSLIGAVLKVESFDELYKLLGFEYVLESSGNLTRLPDNRFQMVVSAGVLEHVGREGVPGLIKETHRILKPEGWALHSIDTSDHLAHYDTKVSKKLYLSFPERTWKCWFENEVQYINRIRRSEWLEVFQSNGFELIEEATDQTDISGVRLADQYADADRRDLECIYLRLVLTKAA
jgi:SAM-dependent methyltransferase